MLFVDNQFKERDEYDEVILSPFSKVELVSVWVELHTSNPKEKIKNNNNTYYYDKIINKK